MGFYVVFIDRTAFVVDGEMFFTLRDDAMISMRYAKNLVEGYGLAWNYTGAPVEGYTNFLWVLWMAVLHLLPITAAKISLAVSMSGAAILVANMLVVRSIALRLSDEWGAITAMALTGLYYPLIYWTLRGMEVGLLALLVNAALLHLIVWKQTGETRNLVSVAIALCVGVLVRPDAIVPAAVVIAAIAWIGAVTGPAGGEALLQRLGPAAVVALAVFATVAAHTAFRVWYYGDPLPNTYYLKVSGVTVAERAARGFNVLLPIFKEHLIVPLVVALYGLWRAREFECSVLWGLLIAVGAYSVYVGGDAWEYFRFANRYVSVVMPALFVLVGLSVSGLREDLENFDSSGHHRVPQLLLAATLMFVGLLALRVAVDSRFFVWFRQAQGAIALATLSAAFGWAAMYWVAAKGRRFLGVGVTTVVVAATLLGSNASAILGQWLPRAGAAVLADNARARLGLLIEASTDTSVSIAVTAAGNIPYFANRHTEDFLGKVDPVIAHLQPRDEFLPGHDRWDYQYSVGRLEPDLLVNLWSPTELEYLYFATLGYRDVFGQGVTESPDDAPCPGYMGAHGLGCSCQDGSFFSGMTCDLLVRDGAAVDVGMILNNWGFVRGAVSGEQ